MASWSGPEGSRIRRGGQDSIDEAAERLASEAVAMQPAADAADRLIDRLETSAERQLGDSQPVAEVFSDPVPDEMMPKVEALAGIIVSSHIARQSYASRAPSPEEAARRAFELKGWEDLIAMRRNELSPHRFRGFWEAQGLASQILAEMAPRQPAGPALRGQEV